MLKRLSYLLYAVIFMFLVTGTRSAAAQEITVMTRNLYIGADLGPVIAATTPEEFLTAAQTALVQVARNNFPERAQALASEIVEKRPHLVGLQEVYSITFNGVNGPPPFRDQLADLMSALAEQGADYRVAAVVRDINIHVPLGGNLVGVMDRDVILARSDVDTDVVPVAESGLCRPSLDGCNYQVVATATTPLGVIAIERGFVAVDATVAGKPVRFVDTHLELPARELDPTNPLASIFQSAQAFELVSILAGFPNPKAAKIVVVGDINSTPLDQIISIGTFTIVPPYMQLAGAGYTDAWTLRPGDPPGLTCCQAEDLLNLDSILADRRDVTFSSEVPYGMVKVNLVGNDEADKTASGLWPSDHAGVVTRMEFAQ